MTQSLTRPSATLGRSDARTLSRQRKHTAPAVTNQALWPHQRVGLDAIHRSIKSGDPSGLIAMPTGSGKSRLFATAARELGEPTLILVHRDELVLQAVNEFGEAWPAASVGVVKAECDEWSKNQQVVVASVQTLRSGRLSTIPRNRFGLVIADEAHHAVADSWRAIIDHFSDRRYLLGTTATPERLDGKGLDCLFGERPIYSYALRQAIEDGVLVRLRQYCVTTDTDLSGVSSRAGDYAVNELAGAINTGQRNQRVVDAYRERCVGRRAICFSVDVDHAHALTKLFNDSGVKAATVHGGTPIDERRATLVAFRQGEIQVACNCEVLCEGFDDPGVSAILMARPTASRNFYTQCCGRALRRCDDEGKRDAIIIDLADNSRRHKFITVTDLFGTIDSHDADGADVVDYVDEETEARQKREKIDLLAPLSWHLERVCPWPKVPSLLGYVPSRGWQSTAASPKQIKFLRGLGLEPDRVLTKGECGYLLDRALELRAAHPEPPTNTQRWFLKQRGRWQRGLTRAEAHKLIGTIKDGGGR